RVMSVTPHPRCAVAATAYRACGPARRRRCSAPRTQAHPCRTVAGRVAPAIGAAHAAALRGTAARVRAGRAAALTTWSDLHGRGDDDAVGDRVQGAGGDAVRAGDVPDSSGKVHGDDVAEVH